MGGLDGCGGGHGGGHDPCDAAREQCSADRDRDRDRDCRGSGDDDCGPLGGGRSRGRSRDRDRAPARPAASDAGTDWSPAASWDGALAAARTVSLGGGGLSWGLSDGGGDAAGKDEARVRAARDAPAGADGGGLSFGGLADAGLGSREALTAAYGVEGTVPDPGGDGDGRQALGDTGEPTQTTIQAGRGLDALAEERARAVSGSGEGSMGAAAAGAQTGGVGLRDPMPPPDTVMQGLREGVASTAGRTQGEAQALGGLVGDMVGGAAAAVETGYEATVVGIEGATDLVGDDYARAQRDDLAARRDAFVEAAEAIMTDPAGVVEAIAESFEARYAQADALEGAYRGGHADLSVYREAERIRGEADTELAILGVETVAVAAGGAGAAMKALRAARIADRVDGAAPIAIAMATTQRARAGAEAVDMLAAQPGRRTQFSADDLVRWVDENASMSPAARDYDDGATGSRSNVKTQLGQAPSIDRTLPSGETRPVRFDGLDDDVLIDRKRSVVTTRKVRDQIVRQSEALDQNGLTARWEVPTDAQAARAQRMFDELGVNNITVEVVSE